jgi:hypothetical protein
MGESPESQKPAPGAELQRGTVFRFFVPQATPHLQRTSISLLAVFVSRIRNASELGQPPFQRLFTRVRSVGWATGWLLLDERAEHRWPPILEVAVPLESALQQSLDPLLRFRPRQCGLKRGDGVEEPVGGWQRDLVNEILRRRDSTPETYTNWRVFGRSCTV